MFDSWFENGRWAKLVLASAVLLGLFVSMPQWLHMLDSRYEGVPVHLNSDEFSYMPRLQEALLGRGDRIGTAVTGGEEDLPELQAGLIEQAYGFLFRPFGWRATTVFTVMDFFAPLLLFFALIGFLQACGLSRKRAFIAAWVFCLLELYNLGRPVHQRISFLLTLLALWCLIEGLEYKRIWGIVGGALMGLLVGVYFWSWTAVWAWWGILFLWRLGEWFCFWWHDRKVSQTSLLHRCVSFSCRIFGKKKKKIKPDAWQDLLLFGGVGVLTAIPFFWQQYRASQHPIYEEVFFRSGIGSSHSPESWPWSILFLLMAVGVVLLWWKKREQRTIYLICTVVTAFAILNQHIVHGIRFLFASHYLFFLVFAGVLAATFSWGKWNRWGILAICAAGVFLAGIAYDNRSLIAQWRADSGDFSEQHLASMLPVFDELDRAVVLTDPATSGFIASHTKHDVLYTRYIMNELRSHQENAERYCLTHAPVEPSERRLEFGNPVYGAAYDAVYDEEGRKALHERERELVFATCSDMDADIPAMLRRYNVKYILWDEKRRPEWILSRLGVDLKEVGRGDWWSLWDLTPSPSP